MSDNRPKAAPQSAKWPRPFEFGIGLLALLAASLPVYFHIFYRFSWWDDEGFLLATVKAVLQGHILFDRIYTLYGPFYYLVEWIFYAATGLSPSHDCVRSIAFVLWVSSAVVLAYAAYRFAASLLAGAFTLVAIIEILVFFEWEPGHPEEVCVLLLACFIACLVTISGRLSNGKMAALGFLVAALAQTKINIGLYAALALLLTLLATRAGGGKRAFLAAGTVLSIGFLSLIAAPVLRLPWARNYFGLVVFSFLSVAITASFTETRAVIELRAWWTLILAFLGSWVAIIAPFLLRGTTVPAFLYITIFQHKHFAEHWFKPTPVRTVALLGAAFSLVLSLSWLWLVRQRRQQSFFPLVTALKAMLGLFAALQLLAQRVDWPLGYKIMMVVLPFTWLILLPPPADIDRKRFARIALAFVAVFVSMYSFPVAGSQNLFSILPLVIVAGVFLRDSAATLFAHRSTLSLSPFMSWSRYAGYAAALLVIAASYGRDLHYAYRTYSNSVSLGLPGSANVHVPPSEASTYQWLTQTLDARCSSFYSAPGLFSLYFWTRQDSPTLLIMNDWPPFFSPAQQRIVLGDMGRHRTSCIVYNPSLLKFWSVGEKLPPSPVMEYMQSAFVPIAQRDGYYIMARRNKIAALNK